MADRFLNLLHRAHAQSLVQPRAFAKEQSNASASRMKRSFYRANLICGAAEQKYPEAENHIRAGIEQDRRCRT
jgi:hypothetical protein